MNALADLETSHVGKKGALFRLALGTGALTVLTAGLYRFWMKTRLRRYLWSSVKIGGVPLEYTGDPWEKLLGFLFAVVVMAFYIGVVNLLLMYFSFSLFQTDGLAYLLSFLGALPLLFFARYRARRYVLARTRWRGIRFGLEPGAWGYAWRAALHWLATILTLGLLWPRKAFYLEKYLTDRTRFGDAPLKQGGRWTMLLGAMKHLYIGGYASAAVIALAIWKDRPQWLLWLLVTLPWTFYGLAYWRAHAFRLLTSHKRIGGEGQGDAAVLANSARAGRVLGIYLSGYLLSALVVLVGAAVLFFAVGFVIGFVFAGMLGMEGLPEVLNGSRAPTPGAPNAGMSPPVLMVMALGALTYFTAFLLWNAAQVSFVTLPLMRHFAETTRLQNPLALNRIRQRDRDAFAEAEGFADALDVGAAL